MTVYLIFTYIGIAALIISLLRYLFAKPSNIFINYLQNFVGSLFIFSGFVKAVDPLGTSYKMLEYFEAMKLEIFAPFSTSFSVIMIVLEILAGVAIIIGWRPKLTASVLLLMTLFFTALTGFTYISGYAPTLKFWMLFGGAIVSFSIVGILEKPLFKNVGWVIGIGCLLMIFVGVKFSTSALFSTLFAETGMKVTDCGCFGDFIKLKPWETFWKDVFLDVIILFLALNYKKVSTLFLEMGRGIIAYGTAIVTLFFCLYNFVWSEPVIDFRPYKIGNNIVDLRKVVKPEEKKYVFVYKNKKTGEEKDFSTEELGSITEDWEYKDRKDIIIDAGIPAKITNLFIFNENGEDITDELLEHQGYSLIVVAYKLNNTHVSAFEQLNKIAEKADKNGIKFYALSSEDAEDFRHEHQCAYPFYTADETPLKTIQRSNPGLLLLKDGVVVNKWHYKHLPTFEELQTTYFAR